jgi:hypothetical protein
MTGTHPFRLFLRIQAAGIARRVMSYKRRGGFNQSMQKKMAERTCR